MTKIQPSPVPLKGTGLGCPVPFSGTGQNSKTNLDNFQFSISNFQSIFNFQYQISNWKLKIKYWRLPENWKLIIENFFIG